MRAYWLRIGFIVALTAVALPAAAQVGAYVKLNFVCSPSNDIYRLLLAGGQPLERFNTVEEAVEKLPSDSALFILADQYPFKAGEYGEELVDSMAMKNMRVYAEFVASWHGKKFGEPVQAESKNVVVATGSLKPYVQRGALLSVHDCHYVPIPYPNPILVLGRTAGFDSAAFEIPKPARQHDPEQATPLLAQFTLAPHFIAATKLSNLTTGRYAPIEEWRGLWQGIIKLVTGTDIELPPVAALAKPSFGLDAALPDNAESEALRRAAEWYHKSKLLVHAKAQGAEPSSGGVAPFPGMNAPSGDGSEGVFQGFSSRIDAHGNNMVLNEISGDSTAESAFALASAGKALRDPRHTQVARNLLEFLYQKSEWLTAAGAADAASCDADAKARAALAAIGAAAVLETEAFDGQIAEHLASLLEIARNETVSPTPQQKAGLWACYLWAYGRSGFAPFLEEARAGIAKMMEAYPDGWRWTTGLQQERARMLLPLAWLVRVEDSQTHRQWLQKVAEDLLAAQADSGAIREELGREEQGLFPPPASNDEFGKRPAPIIQKNGDDAADLLYTCGFALLGLREAAAATGDSLYSEAEQRLTEFLCRSQVKSILHPEIDGTWFRAFHLGRWDFWGSNADAERGVWSTQTGWSHAWGSVALGLRLSETSYWEMTAKSTVKQKIEELQPKMLPSE